MSGCALLAVLGVLFAFPLKKRFINDEQLPFPEGCAAGVVMDTLHTRRRAGGAVQGQAAGLGAALSALRRAAAQREADGCDAASSS